MSTEPGSIFQRFADSAAPKSIVLSIVFTGIGFVTKQAVEQYRVDETLSRHTQQIEKLVAGQDLIRNTLEVNHVTLTGIDGKIDVLSTMIADDRRSREGWQSRQTSPHQK